MLTRTSRPCRSVPQVRRAACTSAPRYRNNLSFRVTGFMSEEVFSKVLGEYEQELRRRIDR